PSAPPAPSTASRSACRPVRSPASSAPTGRASRRPSASCSACCERTRAPPRSSAVTRGATPSPSTAAPPTSPVTRARGRPLRAVAGHRRLADVPGDTSLWPALTGGEAIDVLTRHETGTAHRRRRAELLERFELDPTKRTRTYSKGNRQKVALVAALSRDVELYLLDEPTSGLDPLMEAVFTEEVRKLRDDGRTVLL